MIRLRRDWPQLAGLTIGLALVALAVHGSYVFGIPLWQWELGCFGLPLLVAVVLAILDRRAAVRHINRMAPNRVRHRAGR